MTTSDGKFFSHSASSSVSPTTSASPPTVAVQPSPDSASRRTRSAAALSSLMSSGGGIVHDGEAVGEPDHLEQAGGGCGGAHHDELRAPLPRGLLGPDHRREAPRVP